MHSHAERGNDLKSVGTIYWLIYQRKAAMASTDSRINAGPL